MFRPFPNGPQQQPYPSPMSNSWYPSTGMGPPQSSSRPSSSGPPAGFNPLLRASPNDSRPQSPQPGNTLLALKDKSVDELRKLLSDKEAYDKFLHSIEEVKQLDTLRNDLRKSNIHLANHNLAKESELAELRNQCTIIRTTELATVEETFAEARRQEKEILSRSSPAALLDKLQHAATMADDESESLHRKLLNGELEFAEFLQKYKQLRILYHKRTLIRLAALASLPPG